MALNSLILSLFFLLVQLESSQYLGFTFNGFESANLTLDGIAEVKPNGLLVLTNGRKEEIGHAFFAEPINFKSTSNGSVFSFSTTFVFSIVRQNPMPSGHGIAFVIAPTPHLPGALPSKYLGLFNKSSNGNFSNHVIAVELDTVHSSEFNDINDNHVGIDINDIESVESKSAGYYGDKTSQGLQNLSLSSGKAMQVWVDYNRIPLNISVSIAPINTAKPTRPLLSLHIDLSLYFYQTMYVGFSSSTSSSAVASHYIFGWSFKNDGTAAVLNLSQLPKLPRIGPKKISKLLTIGLPLILALILLIVISGGVYHVFRKRRFVEVLESWEHDYGPHRFKYKDLYIATKGFKEKGLLGSGGFGRVYKGTLPRSKIEIAVKKVSHESRQGMREFVSEIVSIGRLRHRNLVQLLGYCRRKGELLLVYDYMPNGSLDKFLYDQPKCTLNWQQRFKVIKGVASGLLYLHEEWEQVVVHRDVKASNVLLDGELNGGLGDFGLSRLYDHGTDPQTTHVVGTIGYLAPEHTRTGKATPSTDVYAFGAFLLEVACGRRPIDPKAPNEYLVLVEWVFSLWTNGEIIGVVDQNLISDYVASEVELVLKLGLVCSHPEPLARPSMRHIVQYLEGQIPLPELATLGISASGLCFAASQGFSFLSSTENTFMNSTSAVESLLSGPR